jgi:hypothetical protein
MGNALQTPVNLKEDVIDCQIQVLVSWQMFGKFPTWPYYTVPIRH